MLCLKLNVVMLFSATWCEEASTQHCNRYRKPLPHVNVVREIRCPEYIVISNADLKNLFDRHAGALKI
jgi:hypothetical protein